MDNNASFSLPVGISLLAVFAALGIISWISGLTYIA